MAAETCSRLDGKVNGWEPDTAALLPCQRLHPEYFTVGETYVLYTVYGITTQKKALSIDGPKAS